MTACFLYDDARARAFAPFALTRPASEMLVGTELARTRWERALGVRATGLLTAPHLAHFEQADCPRPTSGAIPAGAIVANSRCAPALAASAAGADAWTCGDRVAAVRLARALPGEELAGGALALESLVSSGASVAPIAGRWIDEVWEYVTLLPAQLREDILAMGPELSCGDPPHAIRMGDEPLFVESGARVEPQVCFDTTAGPILVRHGAVVRAFTRLEGPCAIGPGSIVLGDRVSGSSIGPRCVVRGELSQTVILGFSNKGHDGFVGHSYLGEWVNLGAGTITSNLKNTYGPVHLWTPAGVRDTGATKLGSLIGDHVKTGIGTRFTTGCVVGAGSNIYGPTMPPKHVPPFSWGEGNALMAYRLDRFLQVAERAMARRSVALTAEMRRQLAEAHALRLATS